MPLALHNSQKATFLPGKQLGDVNGSEVWVSSGVHLHKIVNSHDEHSGNHSQLIKSGILCSVPCRTAKFRCGGVCRSGLCIFVSITWNGGGFSWNTSSWGFSSVRY